MDKSCGEVYALQKDHATQGWHEIAKITDGLKEIRLMGPPAKNKVDNKIINDVRELLGNCVPAKTCVFIVSSDSDYWDVVKELKDVGVRVVGIGEPKANVCYKELFHRFIELEEEESDESGGEDVMNDYSPEPLPAWYVGGSDAYRYGETP